MVRDGGASWAFVALHLLSRTPATDRAQEAPLLGCAHLLGLLVERSERKRWASEEKVRRAEDELRQMKVVRTEDAKANEKVVAIFSSHEQSWIAERKRLRLQIRALAGQLQSMTTANEDAVSNLSYRVTEAECEVRAKDEALEEETKRREEIEERLQLVEREFDKLREQVKREEQDHAGELQRHKDAFEELISNQRELEAEMARALEQAKTTKQELDQVFESKEEAELMVERLSDKIGKMQGDAEQKDKILSALLRKSKLDAQEKEMLLKEVKMAKAKKKQAELEAEKWKNKWESRQKKGSRSSSCSVEAAASSQEGMEEALQANSTRFGSTTPLPDYFDSRWEKEQELLDAKGGNVIAAIKCLDHYSSQGRNYDLVPVDVENLQDWVRMETQKYATILEQKHFAEIEAFTEQMRLKDEKLEAFRWRLISKDMESKRLNSQIAALGDSLSQLREENFKLEAVLLEREGEMKSLRDQFSIFIHHCQGHSLKQCTNCGDCEISAEINPGTEKQSEIELEVEDSARSPRRREERILEKATTHDYRDTTQLYRDEMVTEVTGTNSSGSAPSTENDAFGNVICIDELSLEDARSVDSYDEQQAKSIVVLAHSPKIEIEEEKEVTIDLVHVPQLSSTKEANVVRKRAPVEQSIKEKESSRKMDIHALGVSYKIKRLKQQLLVLEKLAGMKQIASNDNLQHDSPRDKRIDDEKQHLKGIPLVIHLLNKQVKRFQSLEGKTDNLCDRMHESIRGGDRRDSYSWKEKSRVLENFLEETFQLQRLMVATGQKLMEVQSKITGNISNRDDLDESAGFNMEQFADVIRTLFREIQRGLEVRIARIIGDLEGTLASDGIRHIR